MLSGKKIEPLLYSQISIFPSNSHVIPALIREVHEAQQKELHQLSVWGDGSTTREFLYSTDAALGIVMGTQHDSDSKPVNR